MHVAPSLKSRYGPQHDTPVATYTMLLTTYMAYCGWVGAPRKTAEPSGLGCFHKSGTGADHPSQNFVVIFTLCFCVVFTGKWDATA